MKAKIIAFLFSLIAIAPLSAQQYRGFVDVSLCADLCGGTANPRSDIRCEGTIVGVGGMTSHGVQFHKLFVGAGAGYIFTGPSHSIPLFADVRWDFFGNRGVNPFVGLRLGYTAVLDPESYNRDVNYKDSEHTHNYSESNEASFYFQPTVGLRIRTAPKFGLNISLSYIPIKQCIKDCQYACDNAETIKSYTRGYIALGFGFDF